MTKPAPTATRTTWATTWETPGDPLLRRFSQPYTLAIGVSANARGWFSRTVPEKAIDCPMTSNTRGRKAIALITNVSLAPSHRHLMAETARRAGFIMEPLVLAREMSTSFAL